MTEPNIFSKVLTISSAEFPRTDTQIQRRQAIHAVQITKVEDMGVATPRASAILKSNPIFPPPQLKQHQGKQSFAVAAASVLPAQQAVHRACIKATFWIK